MTSNCSKSKVKKDTFECEEISYKKDNFIVAKGKYKEYDEADWIDMIAMRWIVNPEKNVKDDKELQYVGFPFDVDRQPVWFTVSPKLVKSMESFFQEETKKLSRKDKCSK